MTSKESKEKIIFYLQTQIKSYADEKVKGSSSFKILRYCPNVSITTITAMGCQQCLPLSVVQLEGKHCRKPHCRNGVVDMFGRCISARQDNSTFASLLAKLWL